jgi:hypothetical protein
MKVRLSLPILAFVLTAIFAATPLRSQNVLPAQFGRWTSSGSAQATVPSGGAREVFAESGLDASEARSYSNGTASVQVSSFVFHDTSGSYEAYTYVRGPLNADGAVAKTAGAAAATPVLIGNVVLVIADGSVLTSEDQKLLSEQVKQKADKTPAPPIPNYLPEKDRVEKTELYALGPSAFRAALANLGRAEYADLASEAGFNNGGEAMLARYRAGREDAVLLLIEYPTPQMAGLHWKHLAQALPASAKQTGTSIERKGSLLAIVLSPSSAAYAERLRQAVRYETQVTWNEPTHTITDPPITSVLAKIIMATGAFMLVAIVFGVAFGGVRVLLKSLFPGKVFDRPEQMDVLQLGISSKRIDSRDFY